MLKLLHNSEAFEKGRGFLFAESQLDAIEKLKTLITSAPILNDFDPNLPRRLKIDASSEGLGAVLKQNHDSLENPQWHPIGYLSRTLCDYEKLYAQIEEEILSINFGVEHFRKYLHGRKFTIVNDHRPLKLIFSRSMVTCPFRIQKCFLQFQKYDFQLEYAPGKTMLVSDTFSRSYLNDIKPEFDLKTLIWHVHLILLSLPISQPRLDQFRLETQKDQILQIFICYTINGWLEKYQVPKEVPSSTPTAVKLLIMKEFFWRTKES